MSSIASIKITNKRRTGNVSAECDDYQMSGDYVTKEDGTVTDLSGNVYSKNGDGNNVSVNVYDNGNGRKININAATLSDVSGISAFIDSIVSEIESGN